MGKGNLPQRSFWCTNMDTEYLKRLFFGLLNSCLKRSWNNPAHTRCFTSRHVRMCPSGHACHCACVYLCQTYMCFSTCAHIYVFVCIYIHLCHCDIRTALLITTGAKSPCGLCSRRWSSPHVSHSLTPPMFDLSPLHTAAQLINYILQQ